jgi:Zn-dependent protease
MESALDRLDRPPPGSSSPRKGVAAGVGAAGVLALAKGKALFAALKLGKLAVTAWTMILAVGVYATYYGFSYALGLVLLILVHELGHGFAAWQVGLPVGAPIFVPFFGAFIALKDRPKSRWQELVVAAGGPIVGGLASGACVAVSFVLGERGDFFFAIGYTGLVLNLFNLMPFWQLDGARMLGAVEPRAGLVGVIVVAVAFVGSAILGRMNVIALLAVVLFGFRVGNRFAHRPRPASLLDRLAALDQPVPPRAPEMAEGRAAAVVTFVTLGLLVVAVQLLAGRLPAVR